MRAIVAAVVSCASAVAASAADLPRIAFLSLGYRELRPEELAGAPGPVALSVDLTNDGRVDEARVLVNAARRDAVVVVVSSGPDKIDTYVLRRTDIATAAALRLSAVDAQGRRALRIEGGPEPATTELFDGEDFRTVPSR